MHKWKYASKGVSDYISATCEFIVSLIDRAPTFKKGRMMHHVLLLQIGIETFGGPF